MTRSAAAAPATVDSAKEALLRWFRDAKYGLFIHWGLYSIPAGTLKGQSVPGIGEVRDFVFQAVLLDLRAQDILQGSLAGFILGAGGLLEIKRIPGHVGVPTLAACTAEANRSG